MSQSRVLVLLAGAALSIGAPALAQNANLDQDRAYQAELMNDSATRASLLQGGGGGASYDAGGFSFGDGSGNNQLYIGGAARFRYQHNFRDEDAVGTDNDFTHGFSNNSTRLWTWGHVWSKDLTYRVQLLHTSEGAWDLEDAWGEYTWDSGFAVRWGQFKLPLLREENVDQERQLAIDRSIMNDVFTQGYSQGAQLSYTSDAWRVVGVFSDGLQTGNTDFDSAAESDYALTARVDFKIMGSDWNRFNDFTSFRSQDNAALVGAAIHWQDGGETGGTLPVEVLRYTIDGSFEGKGWNVYAAFVGDHTESEDTTGSGADTDSDNFGGLVQGGIFVTEQVELFARWDGIFWDSDTVNAAGDEIEDSHFISAGVNYYISPESHAVKFTGQIIWALEDTSILFSEDDPSTPEDESGFLSNSSNSLLGQTESNEVGLGFQMQVMF
jgi:hypothetical protein